MAAGGESAAPASGPGPPAPTGLLLRPLVFVVDAVRPAAEHQGGDHGGAPAGDDGGAEEASLYDEFLAALRDDGGGRDGAGRPDDASVAASYASSAPLSPGSLGTPRQSPSSSSAPPASSSRRFASPFARLLGSPRGPPAGGVDDPATPHDAIARDMADEVSGPGGSPSASSGGPDAAASALASYSKEPPPVRFLSRRARVVSVSRRHVFPPSRYPEGKLASDPDGRPVMLDELRPGPGGTAAPASWSSARDVRSEGVLPSGWLEKHARALPSAVLVVTAIHRSDARARVGAHCRDALADLRMSMASKRNVPVHLAVIVREGDTAVHSGHRVGMNAIRESVCLDVGLPAGRVTLLRYPEDLGPDSFESGILGSRYLGGGHAGGDPKAAAAAGTAVMNPALRSLDRSLRDSSAAYYARLAENQERKLQVWRDRHRGTNPGFGTSTLLASMRCARYSVKSATLRELEMRAGAGSDGGGGRWTDRTSAPMRRYEEAYRWSADVVRGRCVSWRAESNARRAASAPATPGKPRGVTSPRVTQSPGGGLGVELSLPPELPGLKDEPPSLAASARPPPPPPPGRPPRPADADAAFYSRLWDQSRAVSGWINSRLLRATSPGGVTSPADLEAADGQWARHRILYHAGTGDGHDDGGGGPFGPAWRDAVRAADETRAYSCVAEGRWRQGGGGGGAGGGGGYHRPLAPWRAYAELCAGLLRVNRILLGGVDVEDCGSTERGGGGSGYGKFVGSVSSSGTGVGSTRWALECEMRKDHRAMALDCALHALDLLVEDGTGADGPPTARLRYLAGRLLMSLGRPAEGIVHLEKAAAAVESWPCLRIAVGRAALACRTRIAAAAEGAEGGAGGAGGSEASSAGISEPSVRALLTRERHDLLSGDERSAALTAAFGGGGGGPVPSVLWTDVPGGPVPPFEYAATFVRSTHASAGDTVRVAVSLRSRLGFPASVAGVELVTTAGTYHVPLVPVRLTGDASADGSGRIDFAGSGATARLVADLSVPTSPAGCALGGPDADLAKFVPRGARLSNSGMSRAAGGLSGPRPAGSGIEGLAVTGKSVPLSQLPEDCPPSLFLGGVPLVCHGVVLALAVPGDADGTASPVRLEISSPSLLSPLGRSGQQSLSMEEANFTSHAWSRPDFHPWSLGPRVLRVLSPRPAMAVVDLTAGVTGGRAVEGTVHRTVLRLTAGDGVVCRDVRVTLRCASGRAGGDGPGAPDGAAVEPGLLPTLVVREGAAGAAPPAQPGPVVPPKGWVLRAFEGPDGPSPFVPLLDAGASALLPLDIYCPPDGPREEGGGADGPGRTTRYEAVVAYRQCRPGGGGDGGDDVAVVHAGTVEWVRPFAASFVPGPVGPGGSLPGGIVHASNAVGGEDGGPPERRAPSSPGGELVAAADVGVRVRCILEPTGLGARVAAARVLSVTNEDKVIYSSDSDVIMSEPKVGTKLSLSYSFTPTTKNGSKSRTPLGEIRVSWTPANLALPDDVVDSSDASALGDDPRHGPLAVEGAAPVTFLGPACTVVDAPFTVELTQRPSLPRVGAPFHLTYRVTNNTAKNQSLWVSMGDEDAAGGGSSGAIFLSGGKVQEEVELAPFERRACSFTLMGMVAGRSVRPAVSIASNRYQTWVVRETLTSHRQVFVMP